MHQVRVPPPAASGFSPLSETILWALARAAVIATRLTDTGSGEVLARVTHLGALGRVTNCEPKAREELFGVGAGGRLPLPLSVTLVTPPLALWLISSAAT